MGVPSLGYLCRQAVIANIDELAYVGELPYESVKDLLVHVKYATQLQAIEKESPQIVDRDDELWEALVRKDFRLQVKRMEKENGGGPLNVMSWKELHERLRKEDAEREAEAYRKLSKSLAKLDKARDKNRTGLADPRKLPKVPGPATRSQGTFFPRGGFISSGAKNESLVAKARKEAQELAKRRRLALLASNPEEAKWLPNRKMAIAPKGLKDEYRIQRQPKFLPRISRPPKRPSAEDEERAKREARLLAAKKPKDIADDDLDTTMDEKPQAGSKIFSSVQSNPSDNAKPHTSSSPQKTATTLARRPSSLFSSGLFSGTSDLSKPQIKIKTVTTTALVSSSKLASGSKAKSVFSKGSSSSTTLSSHPPLTPPLNQSLGGGGHLPKKMIPKEGMDDSSGNESSATGYLQPSYSRSTSPASAQILDITDNNLFSEGRDENMNSEGQPYRQETRKTGSPSSIPTPLTKGSTTTLPVKYGSGPSKTKALGLTHSEKPQASRLAGPATGSPMKRPNPSAPGSPERSPGVLPPSGGIGALTGQPPRKRKKVNLFMPTKRTR